jgi:hypothetical protein
VKLSWIAAAILLVVLAGAIYPSWRLKHPPSPSSFEPARENQATPVDTVNAMFQMMWPGPDGESMENLINDRFDDTHLLLGKNMSPKEQEFAQLFWDYQCSAVIYDHIRLALAKSPRITEHNEAKDSATVTFSLSVVPDHGEEYTDVTSTLDMKKKGPNWHISEMRTPRFPDGVYKAFKQRLDAIPSFP